MSIIIIAPDRDVSAWVKEIRQYTSERVAVWPDFGKPEDVTLAILWKHPKGVLKQFSNLKLISSMGAGVDHVLEDEQLPNVPIMRIVDDALKNGMSNYIIAAVQYYHRKLDIYEQLQTSCIWRQDISPIRKLSIGIMGLGKLGQDVAKKLVNLNFIVAGYSKSRKVINHVKSYAGKENLDEFLAQTNLLICLLPLTSETENILNYALFKKMPKGAFVINVARGKHLVEDDLITALDENILAGAFLDVFRNEPLPENHPFWRHPKIKITPHIASVTNIKAAVPLIMDNYQHIDNHESFSGLVDKKQQY